jgi:hypothetical protein
MAHVFLIGLHCIPPTVQLIAFIQHGIRDNEMHIDACRGAYNFGLTNGKTSEYQLLTV